MIALFLPGALCLAVTLWLFARACMPPKRNRRKQPRVIRRWPAIGHADTSYWSSPKRVEAE